jgi:hypothetical protein
MRPLILTAAVLLASCAAPPPPPGAELARVTAGRVAGPPQTCVTTFGQQNLRVVDSSTLAYGDGRSVYINHLPGPCPGLSQFNTIIIEPQGSQYCRGDRVRALQPGSIIPGPTCNLGDWVPYSMH